MAVPNSWQTLKPSPGLLVAGCRGAAANPPQLQPCVVVVASRSSASSRSSGSEAGDGGSSLGILDSRLAERCLAMLCCVKRGLVCEESLATPKGAFSLDYEHTRGSVKSASPAVSELMTTSAAVPALVCAAAAAATNSIDVHALILKPEGTHALHRRLASQGLGRTQHLGRGWDARLRAMIRAARLRLDPFFCRGAAASRGRLGPHPQPTLPMTLVSPPPLLVLIGCCQTAVVGYNRGARSAYKRPQQHAARPPRQDTHSHQSILQAHARPKRSTTP